MHISGEIHAQLFMWYLYYSQRLKRIVIRMYTYIRMISAYSIVYNIIPIYLPITGRDAQMIVWVRSSWKYEKIQRFIYTPRLPNIGMLYIIIHIYGQRMNLADRRMINGRWLTPHTRKSKPLFERIFRITIFIP